MNNRKITWEPSLSGIKMSLIDKSYHCDQVLWCAPCSQSEIRNLGMD